MARLLRALIVLVASGLGLGGLTAPAHADPYAVTVSSGPGVLYADCGDHAFHYSVAPPAINISWSIRLVLQAPDGTSAGSLFISKGDPTTGVDTKQFCARTDLPGTYTVTGTYEVAEFEGSTKVKKTSTPVTPFTFQMRLAGTKATAKASHKKVKRKKKVRVNVQVTDERPSGGYFPTSSAKVQLQRKQGSRWVGVRGTKDWTAANGKATLTFTFKWKGKARFRVVANVNDLGRSTSRPFTVRTKRR